MSFPYGFTATVKRATQDRVGNITTTPHHDEGGCALAPRSSSESLGQQRDTVTVGLTLYVPSPDADILPTDVIFLPDVPQVPPPYRGTDWQVEGEPGAWISPFTGWAPGIEVALTRVTG